MAQEDPLLQAWGRVAAYSIRKDHLELADAERATVFVFVLAETLKRTAR